MKEKYKLPLTKTEAKQILSVLIDHENTKEKLPKTHWKKHEAIIKKLEIIIYNSKDPTCKS